jgi:hypothetical protein
MHPIEFTEEPNTVLVNLAVADPEWHPSESFLRTKAGSETWCPFPLVAVLGEYSAYLSDRTGMGG